MTNGDKIRSMSNEELYEVIWTVEYCRYCSKRMENYCNRTTGQSCKDGILEYLNQEATE